MHRPLFSWSIVVAAVCVWSLGCEPAATNSANTTAPKKTSGDGHNHGDHDHGDHGHGDHDHGDHDHGTPAKTDDTKKTAKADDHGDHDHHHHGPNNGHLIEVGEEQYHLEWTHTEDGTVTVHVLDGEAKKPVGVDQESLTIETVVDGTATSYELAAVKPAEGEKITKFEIVDAALLGALEAIGEKVTATVKEIAIGEDTFKDLKITHDEHHH